MDATELRTFVHLFETRSVTAAAAELGVTQPTVSYTLGKLRRRFGDELFERTAEGLVPTGVAADLHEPVRAALQALDRVVRVPEEFQPREAEHEFRLMASELGQLSFLPLLADRFAAQAPRCRITAQHLVVDGAVDALTRGVTDLVVTNARLPDGVVDRHPVMQVDYAGLVAADHPRLKGPRPSAARLRAERLIVVRGTSGHEGPLRLVEEQGLTGQVEIELSSFAAVPYVVATGSLVGILPRHIGEVFAARHPVRLVELPWTIPPIEVAAYTRRAPSAAQAWFGRFVVGTLAGERLR